MEYKDKWLSGYCSDRPDFQRMLHDIEMGKIRAVVCYKLDRIGRKTSDLLRLLDYLKKHKVDLLICSNNINTASGVSKIFIQIFAVVAEFERDTLTERITDNMMELAKDGRWLGGNTPTGFTVKRVKTGSGKNKSAYSYLESIPEEKVMIQKLYAVFSETRSIKKIVDRMNESGYRVDECTFRTVDGVLLDELMVKQLSNLSDEDSEYFVKLLNQKASGIFKSSHNEQELIELKKKEV